mmetsp:Transcript_28567/g.47970  ORF Transcript_28567/g.47970 Transcript_28567/m.47970 type:complete len:83 (-) Transcript_28567:1238-1486(-)
MRKWRMLLLLAHPKEQELSRVQGVNLYLNSRVVTHYTFAYAYANIPHTQKYVPYNTTYTRSSIVLVYNYPSKHITQQMKTSH